MSEVLDNPYPERIQDSEKAHTMALAGDRLRTEAIQERKKATEIKLAKLAYDEAADESARRQILNDIFIEVGENNTWRRPDTVRSIDLPNAVDYSQDDINLQRDKQIAGFFGSHGGYDNRAQELERLAEDKESWVGLLYDNPAVEHYKAIYPKLNFEDRWHLEHRVEQAQSYYQGHLEDMPRYREVLKDGKYIPGGLLGYLFSHEDEEAQGEFEPNAELLEFLQDDTTNLAQLHEFLIRQEELKLEAEREEAEDLAQMLADVKNRQVSL